MPELAGDVEDVAMVFEVEAFGHDRADVDATRVHCASELLGEGVVLHGFRPRLSRFRAGPAAGLIGAQRFEQGLIDRAIFEIREIGADEPRRIADEKFASHFRGLEYPVFLLEVTHRAKESEHDVDRARRKTERCADRGFVGGRFREPGKEIEAEDCGGDEFRRVHSIALNVNVSRIGFRPKREILHDEHDKAWRDRFPQFLELAPRGFLQSRTGNFSSATWVAFAVATRARGEEPTLTNRGWGTRNIKGEFKSRVWDRSRS